jgi:hypothetical protein
MWYPQSFDVACGGAEGSCPLAAACAPPLSEERPCCFQIQIKTLSREGRRVLRMWRSKIATPEARPKRIVAAPHCTLRTTGATQSLQSFRARHFPFLRGHFCRPLRDIALTSTSTFHSKLTESYTKQTSCSTILEALHQGATSSYGQPPHTVNLHAVDNLTAYYCSAPAFQCLDLRCTVSDVCSSKNTPRSCMARLQIPHKSPR